MADRTGAEKGKIWRDAIRRAVNGSPKRIDKLARRLVELAETGEGPTAIAALKEIGDRLDGKPKQQIEATGEGGGPLTIQIVRFADDSTAA